MAKKKPPRRRPVDPLRVFVNARSFIAVAMVVDKATADPLLIWPKIVCGAFSLELHLKCLHRIRRRNVRGHDVKKLFEKLSKADRRRIEVIYNEVSRTHPHYASAVAIGCPMDVDSVLTRMSEMFEKGRYWHELQLPQADSKGFAGTPGGDSLSDSIRNRILEIHPDYAQRAKQLVNDQFGMMIQPTSQSSQTQAPPA